MRGDGSVYKTSDGKWRAAIVIDGKRRYIQRSTRAAVLAKIRDMRAARDNGDTVTAAKTPTLKAWLTYYLDEIAPVRCVDSTLDGYRSKCDQVSKHIGRIRLDELKPEHLRKCYKALSVDHAPSYVGQVHRILKRALKIAEREGKLRRNPADLIDGPGGGKGQSGHAYEREDARRILAAAKTHRHPVRWSMALAMGIRQGEMLGIDWDAVDWEAGKVAIRWQLRRVRARHGCGEGRPGERVNREGRVIKATVYPCGQAQSSRCPKRIGEAGLRLLSVKSEKGDRVITLPKPLMEELKLHRRLQVAQRLAEGHRWTGWKTTPPGETKPRVIELVFAQLNGKPLDPRRDHAEWKQLLAEAKVSEARLHDARHTAATTMQAMGIPPKVVQVILGHATGHMTEQYQHVTPEIAEDAAGAISAALWDEPLEGRG